MDKVETINKTKVVTNHNFYCDSCGKYLGSSEELDDGYYDEIGKFRLGFCVDNKWYRVNKCFCKKCKSDYLQKVINNLFDLGFEREE